MSGRFLDTSTLPFCPGCGHTVVGRNLEAALSSIPGLAVRDVVVVTDIGCIGIVDRCFATHTVHGLHGRSVALASGIRMGIGDTRKRIVVLLGDGGATIGLQHLLDAAHRNLDMTVIVHDNMLYGMTGGQPSALTPRGYRTPIMPGGKPDRGVDLCALVAAAGASYVLRLIASGDFSAGLREALEHPGFSFVEAMGLCTSHGSKLNPGRGMREIVAEAGLATGRIGGNPRNGPALSRGEPARSREGSEGGGSPAAAVPGAGSPEGVSPATGSPGGSVGVGETPFPGAGVPAGGVSLFDLCPAVIPRGPGTTGSGGAEPGGGGAAFRRTFVFAGSAGEGVQTAAELLAKAAMACGFNVSKKGSYPVTVGIGFSVAELIVSPAPIRFTGAEVPDVVVVTSGDGLGKIAGTIRGMRAGRVYADAGLVVPETGAELVTRAYRELAGARNASLLATMDALGREAGVPLEAFIQAIRERGPKPDPVALAALLG